MPNNSAGPKPEKLLMRKYVFEGKALKVRVDTVITADGRRSTREIVEHGDSVGIVAVDNNDNVLLVNQYRTPLAKNLLEIPAGGIDKGEDAEATVIRELQEETGYKPRKVERLCGIYLSPGSCSEYLHVYLATDLTPSRLHAEDTAGIEVVPVPAAQIPEMLTSGRIQDGKSIAGLLYWMDFRKKKSG